MMPPGPPEPPMRYVGNMRWERVPVAPDYEHEAIMALGIERPIKIVHVGGLDGSIRLRAAEQIENPTPARLRELENLLKARLRAEAERTGGTLTDIEIRTTIQEPLASAVCSCSRCRESDPYENDWTERDWDGHPVGIRPNSQRIASALRIGLRTPVWIADPPAGAVAFLIAFAGLLTGWAGWLGGTPFPLVPFLAAAAAMTGVAVACDATAKAQRAETEIERR